MKLAVLGSPVAHSLSPVIHNAALDASGIPGRYTARDVDREGLVAAIEELRAGALDGANVTMPHKSAAFGLCDRAEAHGRRAGAVNTLVTVGGAVVGHNTDVRGIRTAWVWAGLAPEGPVLVLGAGGAAAAAVLALEDRPLTLSARRPEAASSLLGALGVNGRVAEFGTPVPGATVVNATPLGMGGEELPEPVLARCAGLFEMAYGAGPTPAERAVAAASGPVSSGVDMLLAQAAAAFRLWTGREPPLEAMRAAAVAASPGA